MTVPFISKGPRGVSRTSAQGPGRVRSSLTSLAAAPSGPHHLASWLGSLNASNSLVGSTFEDRVGNGRVFALPNGMYYAVSTLWDLGVSVNARAVSLGAAMGTTVGPVSLANSVPGVISPPASISWEPARQRLAVGRGTAVSFISYETISFDGFE